ncbi:hypothetical protein C8J30_1322 [Rhodobacter viridis]|uniref:Uncharacterized protein n=2 Tax=Rhodobacter viridis TaxID=1054202 RepID=A0A318TT96_9RHOB|nr:hypothetical protein C8J30_1322 [Rhodobacter viridis]
MTRSLYQHRPDAMLEAERIYKFIGEYVVCFQWLEGRIDEIFLMARGHKRRPETLSWLTRQTNDNKIKEFVKLITSGVPFDPVCVDGWGERLQSVVGRLQNERRRRNGIMHAQFLFDFLPVNVPVLRLHLRHENDVPVFDQEYLSPQRCDQIIEELAQLAFDLNMICVQLRHSYRGPKSE